MCSSDLLKDTTGRRIYNDIAQLAAELRVADIVGVEAMEDDPTTVGVIVNPVDYTLGATAGGQVSMFDQFDIDYNQNKYLIETRLCGALTKLKSAMVLKRVAAGITLVSPTAPTLNRSTWQITIPVTTGITYYLGTLDATTGAQGQTGSALAAGTLTALTAGSQTGSQYTPGETRYIIAVPNTNYQLNTNAEDFWTFQRP